MNIQDFERAYAGGRVNRQISPCGKLVLYDYTRETQYNRDWDDVTLHARGIIFERESGDIIARPFRKFFNMEEHAQEGMEPIPNEEFEVYEKIDGSLGIIYYYNDRWNISTRGSFTSEQACTAESMLYDLYFVDKLDPLYTYLVEIIYPDNRIVVDYGDDRALVLLAVFNTVSGKEDDIENWTHVGWGPALKYDFRNFNAIKALDWDNHEGFVIRFKSGFRMKIKFDNYVKLHRVITELTPKRIYEAWAAGIPVSDNLEDIPDEIFDNIRYWEWTFECDYNTIAKTATDDLKLCLKDLSPNDSRESRKLFASRVLKTTYPGIAFGLFDGKDMREAICKQVYKKNFK